MKKFKNEDGTIRVPHTLVIIAAILLLVAIATYVVPGGIYERFISESGRELVVDGSFEYIKNVPQSIFDVLQSPIDGIQEASQIIAFLFIVGGAFNIITKTKAIDNGIKRAVHVFRGCEIWIIPLIMFLFSLGGAVFGMIEESIPFVAILVPLTLALGYDSIVAVAISFFGCVVGLSTAMMNPFSLGLALEIAGLEFLSGSGYRTIVWFVMTLISILFVMWYAQRIKKNPKLSPMYELDQVRRDKELEICKENEIFSYRHKIILLSILFSLGFIVYGVIEHGFYINEIAAIFLGMGLFSGLLGGLSFDEISNALIEGAKDMIGPALMVGFSRGIVIVATNGQIIDTILFVLSNLLITLPTVIAAYLMLIIQTFINFFVGSGTGQAALTMPIMAPLGDLIDISRQTTVLIYQLGDGLSNAIYPTSATLIACIGAAKIPYSKWLKWMMPLQGILLIASLFFITIALNIGW